MDTLFTYNNLDFLDYNTESSTFCCHLFNHSGRFTRLSLVVEKQNTDETYFVTDLLGYLSFTTSVGCALSIIRWRKLDISIIYTHYNVNFQSKKQRPLVLKC